MHVEMINFVNRPLWCQFARSSKLSAVDAEPLGKAAERVAMQVIDFVFFPFNLFTAVMLAILLYRISYTIDSKHRHIQRTVI